MTRITSYRTILPHLPFERSGFETAGTRGCLTRDTDYIQSSGLVDIETRANLHYLEVPTPLNFAGGMKNNEKRELLAVCRREADTPRVNPNMPHTQPR